MGDKYLMSETGIAADSVEITRIGFVDLDGSNVEVKKVIVEQTDYEGTGSTDAEWTVKLGENPLFSDSTEPLSVSEAGTPEEFIPDQNEYASAETAQLDFDVTGAAGSADDLNVTVVVEEV